MLYIFVAVLGIWLALTDTSVGAVADAYRTASDGAGIHADEKPTLHFLHILLPHVVYRYLPSGREWARWARLQSRWACRK